MPHTDRDKNGDYINLGFSAVYKIANVEGESIEVMTSMQVYRYYDLSGEVINDNDTKNTDIKANELDKNLHQESYSSKILDAKITSIELDLKQLKEYQHQNPPKGPLQQI